MTRPHSLAPEHLGDARAGAALVILITGLGLFIVAIGMVVAGLTASAGLDPQDLPPLVEELGQGRLLLGAGMFVTALTLVAASGTLLVGAGRARLPTVAVSTLVAGLALVGAILVFLRGSSDGLLQISLLVVAAALVASSLVLVRRPRTT